MVRDLCDGQLEGAEIGSTEIVFTPEKIKGGIHTADTKTAGYVSLIFHLRMGFAVRPGFKSGYYHLLDKLLNIFELLFPHFFNAENRNLSGLDIMEFRVSNCLLITAVIISRIFYRK